MNLNRVQLIGRVGRDPEMRLTPDGNEVTQFSLATNRTWKDGSGETREATEWHTIVSWRQLAAQVARLARKGRLVYVEGRIETRSWQDKNTGAMQYRTEIIADVVRMLDSKPDDEARPEKKEERIVGPEGGSWVKQAARDASRTARALAQSDPDRPLDLDDHPF